jgi:cytochrome c oxidase subunit IV
MSSSSEHAEQHHETDGGESDDGMVHSHISSLKLYVGIFLALIFFTVVTVAVSYVHLGSLNLAVAIIIASIKASLVVTFFMHLKYDNKFNALMFVCGLLFIGVFFAYTMNDTEHRQNELNDVQGNKVYLGEVNEKQAPGGYEPKAEPAHSGSMGEEKKDEKPAAPHH